MTLNDRFEQLESGVAGLRADLAFLDSAGRWRCQADVTVLEDGRETRELAWDLYLAATVMRCLDPMQGPEAETSVSDEQLVMHHERELCRIRSGDVMAFQVVTDEGSLRTPVRRRLQQELTRSGEKTRYVSSLARRMSIFDDHTAILGRPQGLPGGIVVRDHDLVGLLIDVYDDFHASARPWAPGSLSEDARMREQVIDMLSSGLVDEAMARRLKVSPRTVARVVSSLMQENSCQTRFQLGMALARQSA